MADMHLFGLCTPRLAGGDGLYRPSSCQPSLPLPFHEAFLKAKCSPCLRLPGLKEQPLPHSIPPPSPSAGGQGGLHRRGLSLSQHQSNMVKSLQQAGCICLILLYPGPGPHLGASDFISILPRSPTPGPQPDPPIPLLKKSGWWSFFREEGRGGVPGWRRGS